MPLDAVGQRLDVARVIVIGRPWCAGPAASASPSARRTPCRRRWRWSAPRIADRAAIRRTPAAALRHQPVEHALRRSDCRSASPSRPSAAASVAPSRGASFSAWLRVTVLQRALVALPVPDRVVVRALAGRPLAQDDELQQRLPQPGRVVDHPPVGQELAQIAPHRPVVGGVRACRDWSARRRSGAAATAGWSAGSTPLAAPAARHGHGRLASAPISSPRHHHPSRWSPADRP